MDPRPGGAAADQCHRGRRATLWTPCQLCHLRQFLVARRRRRPHQKPPRPIRPMGLCHFRRFADRAAADRRPGQYRSGTPTGTGPAILALEGLAVDLVIWNEDRAGYRQLLQEQIMGLIAAGVEAHVIDRQGGIFVRPAEQISDEDRILLQSVARAIITDSRERWRNRINRRGPAEVRVPRLKPTRSHRAEPRPPPGCRAAI